jgi:hypothetical protein
MFNFSMNYGKTIDFEWCGENKLVVAFNSGMVTLLSTRANELG